MPAPVLVVMNGWGPADPSWLRATSRYGSATGLRRYRPDRALFAEPPTPIPRRSISVFRSESPQLHSSRSLPGSTLRCEHFWGYPGIEWPQVGLFRGRSGVTNRMEAPPRRGGELPSCDRPMGSVVRQVPVECVGLGGLRVVRHVPVECVGLGGLRVVRQVPVECVGRGGGLPAVASSE